MKTLFLDFDGPLHPATAIQGKDMATLALLGAAEIRKAGFFCWNEALEDALAINHEIGIVVHSSWRNQPWMSSALAREILGPLGHRFQGFATPHVPRERAVEECITRMGIEDFLILDDAHAEFKKLSPFLIAPNPLRGVSDQSILARVALWSEPSPARQKSLMVG